VLVYYLTCVSLPALPKQPKLFVTSWSTSCTPSLIRDLINRRVRAQTLQQLLHTERMVMTSLAKQADVMLVYEVQLSHADAELK
jgi:hypothetical protein